MDECHSEFEVRGRAHGFNNPQVGDVAKQILRKLEESTKIIEVALPLDSRPIKKHDN